MNPGLRVFQLQSALTMESELKEEVGRSMLNDNQIASLEGLAQAVAGSRTKCWAVVFPMVKHFLPLRARVQQNDTETLGKDVNADRKGNLEEKVGHGNSGYGSDNENPSASKIEQTKAEEEAIARGLQEQMLQFPA